MGITAWLAFMCFLLIAIAILAFIRKAKTIGIISMTIMELGIVVLGYLWFTSPM